MPFQYQILNDLKILNGLFLNYNYKIIVKFRKILLHVDTRFTSIECISFFVIIISLVKHGDVCLEADECPCSWKGKEYFPGDKVISSCHTW